MAEFDLIIEDALIYDGTGGSPFTGSVAVKNGRIAAVQAERFTETAAERINASGLSLSPGFIDSHAHADEEIFTDPGRDHVLRMGVTTEIAGQCGHTESPYPENVDRKLYNMASGNFGGHPFRCFSELAEAVSELPLGVNEAWFTGHGALRTSVMGFENRKAGETEIRLMQKLLSREMEGGALGFSTGLAYVPGIYSDERELSELAKVLTKYGGIYTSHTRSESAGLFSAVQEVIDIARAAGVTGNISHFKACYPGFWDRMDGALRMVDDARAQGLDITMDAYPYTAVSTTTLSAMPSQFLTGGAEAFSVSLSDPGIREAVRKEIYEIDSPAWDNALKHAGPDRFLVVGASETQEFEGLTYTEIARRLSMDDPFDAVIWMLQKNHGHVTDVRFIMKEENVEKVLAHPACTVGSDGIWIKGRDRTCHPRAFGTFPRYLGHYIREREILPREEGIRRITGLPALRYRLRGKGFLKQGYDADMVLFDYDRIIDGGDFRNPFRKNAGIEKVFIGGEAVLHGNELTGVRKGRFLLRRKKEEP